MFVLFLGGEVLWKMMKYHERFGKVMEILREEKAAVRGPRGASGAPGVALRKSDFSFLGEDPLDSTGRKHEKVFFFLNVYS